MDIKELSPKEVLNTEVEEFKVSLKKAQEWAISVGYREEDVDDIIKTLRQRKHKI